MPAFFYDLPIWLSTVLVLGLALAIGLGSSVGVGMLFRLKPTTEEREIAVNLMQVVAAYIAIMLAFSGVAVWQNFADAERAVHQEAASASELYRDLTIYGSEADPARRQLRTYVGSVVNDEWPTLRDGKGSLVTEAALGRLFREFGKISPQDERASVIYAEAFAKMNEMVVFRRDRIIASRNGMPIILWLVGLVGSALTLSYAAAFSRTRINFVMIAGTSVAIGLVFLFILTVDHPFKGRFSVESGDLSQLSATFDRLDRLMLQDQEAGPNLPATQARDAAAIR
jgi:uncharacterized membrane protein (UPF0136 family)